MAKNITGLVSAITLLAISLAACGTNTDNPTTSTQLDSSQDLSTFSSTNTSPVDPAIASQIQASSITQTEWGNNVKALPLVKQAKKATFLSYLAFDNNKGGFRDELRKMINFHELSGTSNIMNMVLQTDSPEEGDLKRYLVIGDSDAEKIVSPYTLFKNERDSGDYRVLQAFAKWGFTTYKSQVKILDIDSHGGAYVGIGLDDSSDHHIISLPNLAKSVKDSVGKVEILNMDACLMGTIEAIYELRDVSDITIGSEDSTLETSMLYTKTLPDIIEKSTNNEQIATKIILASDRLGTKEYDMSIRPNRKGRIPNVFTISAYRSSAVKPFVTELNNLAKILISKLPSQKQAINMALSGTHQLIIDGDETGGQRDLYEILDRLNTVITDTDIKSAITRTRNALNKTIIISRNHNAEKHAQGLAINILAGAVTKSDYQGTAFAKDSNWDEFIAALNK